MKSKRLVGALLVFGVGVVLLVVGLGWREYVAASGPEARIVAYLDENVRPRRPVFVTDLYNNVFTTPEEREALQNLYDSLFEIPAFVAQTYTDTGRIPTLEEVSAHFDFQVPGTTEVLLRVLEADPRVPRFLDRDPATGEITYVDVTAITADPRFGRPLRN